MPRRPCLQRCAVGSCAPPVPGAPPPRSTLCREPAGVLWTCRVWCRTGEMTLNGSPPIPATRAGRFSTAGATTLTFSCIDSGISGAHGRSPRCSADPWAICSSCSWLRRRRTAQGERYDHFWGEKSSSKGRYGRRACALGRTGRGRLAECTPSVPAPGHRLEGSVYVLQDSVRVL